MSCRITHSEINGWRAIKLCNSAIEVTVLPDKGADIYAFVDVLGSIDVLLKTPWGLLPPGSPPCPGSNGDEFAYNYEGAWQELLPNTGPPCIHEGHKIALHGAVATVPWMMRVERDDADGVAICLDVTCPFPPLTLSRRMSVTASSPVLVLDETVRNISTQTVSFLWGHHPVLGSPFLEAGCEMRVAPCTVHTRDTPFDPVNAAYAPAQRVAWPYVRALDGHQVDLRRIPGPDANIHDHACLTDLSRGWVEVENPRLGLTFGLQWDPKVFRWINNWRPLGGSHTPPLEGIYGLALEPWAASGNLAEAIAAGTALSLEAGASLSTWLKAELRNSAISHRRSGS